MKTTPDPELRGLLRVRVEDMQDAETAFSTLMGDVVEPRRDFIVTNALQVERAWSLSIVVERPAKGETRPAKDETFTDITLWRSTRKAVCAHLDLVRPKNANALGPRLVGSIFVNPGEP